MARREDARWPSALALATWACACGPNRAGDNGSAAPDASHVDAATDAPSDGPGHFPCPTVSSIVATPGSAPIGGELDVSVVIDPANAAGIAYGWTTTSGQFENSLARSTRFACTAPGPATLTVQVLGGQEADGSVCVQQQSTTVECFVPPDASPDASSGPCTIPGQRGCFACAGSPSGLCTPTEEAFVDYDPSGACYACLLAGGCIDDTAGGDADAAAGGNECDDLVGDADGGPSAGAWKPSLCRQTVNCILQSGCAAPSVLDCYCGAGVGGACVGGACVDAGIAGGVCLVAESAGLETSDAAVALGPTFASKSLAAGVANAIFLCAAAHHCATCLAGHVPPTDAAADALPE